MQEEETKREEFLEIMEEIIPWEERVSLIVPHYPNRLHVLFASAGGSLQPAPDYCTL